MSEKASINDKFKDMSYETAVGKLTELIGILERNEGTFDELIEVYKEAFQYYTYCSEYLSTSAEKIKDLNAKMAEILPKLED
ncbi:MAG: exodeoxyribonuclease VII small subunit [Clostridia bacterium]|nr:exodeoxyribonuclease VII small subunit [Clostridia bacterium]